MSMVIYLFHYLSVLQIKKKTMLYSKVEVNSKVALEFKNENVYF